ncbi:creatininase family protein [Streptomyces sp. NPDC002990]
MRKILRPTDRLGTHPQRAVPTSRSSCALARAGGSSRTEQGAGRHEESRSVADLRECCDLLPTATSTDFQEQQPRVAVLPIGSFEQHGRYRHGSAIACIIGREIASAYSVPLLPPITMSCSHEHASFPGTVSISAETLFAVVDDIRASLARSGITKLVIVNGHGGYYVLSNIAQEGNVDGPLVSLFPLASDWDRAHYWPSASPSERCYRRLGLRRLSPVDRGPPPAVVLQADGSDRVWQRPPRGLVYPFRRIAAL